jgi:hypothetical protein
MSFASSPKRTCKPLAWPFPNYAVVGISNVWPGRVTSGITWTWRGGGELGPLGGDALAVGIGVEQERCETIGAASQSAHELDELW